MYTVRPSRLKANFFLLNYGLLLSPTAFFASDFAMFHMFANTFGMLNICHDATALPFVVEWISFFIISHYSKYLVNPDFVSITFKMQKNIVTQERNKDPLLCPVKAWARVITKIRKDGKVSDSTPINVIRQDNKLYKIFSKDNIHFLRKTVWAMKDRNLGFEASGIGTHSIRLTMKLLKEEDSIIMLIGRWKSITFLKYIRKQIKEFCN